MNAPPVIEPAPASRAAAAVEVSGTRVPEVALPSKRLVWGVFALAVFLLLLVLHFHLVLALLCTLATYAVRQALVQHMERYLGHGGANLAALLIVLALAACLVGFSATGVAELHEAWQTGRLNRIVESILATLHQFSPYLPNWVVEKLPQTAAQAQLMLMDWFDAHPDKLKTLGHHTARAVAHVLIGVVMGFLASSTRLAPLAQATPFLQQWRARLVQLYQAFTDVVAAQLRIALINTLFTGVYLLVILPLVGYQIPLGVALVVLTFFTSLLPIVGNLISNTAITLVSLTVSPWLAVASLAFLIGIHKLEYFINAKIMGDRLQVRTYELLAVMLLMESIFGVGGLVAAPVYYAWLTRELKYLDLL